MLELCLYCLDLFFWQLCFAPTVRSRIFTRLALSFPLPYSECHFGNRRWESYFLRWHLSKSPSLRRWVFPHPQSNFSKLRLEASSKRRKEPGNSPTGISAGTSILTLYWHGRGVECFWTWWEMTHKVCVCILVGLHSRYFKVQLVYIQATELSTLTWNRCSIELSGPFFWMEIAGFTLLPHFVQWDNMFSDYQAPHYVTAG